MVARARPARRHAVAGERRCRLGSVSAETGAGYRLRAMREARLRPEFADLYPGLTPGRWEPAARIAEAVLANVLLHEMGEAPLQGRLAEAHF